MEHAGRQRRRVKGEGSALAFPPEGSASWTSGPQGEGDDLYWRGLALAKAGRRGDAVRHLTAASACPAWAAAAFLALAEITYQDRQFRSATTWARRALAVRPGWAPARALEARALHQRGHWRQAAARVEEGDGAALALARGITLFARRRFVAAAEAFNTAGAWLAMGRAYYAAGDLERAIRPLSRALKADPGCLRAALLLAEVQRRRGRLSLAERALSHALLLTDRAPRVLWRLARVIAALGRSDEAESLRAEAEARAPSSAPAAQDDPAALFALSATPPPDAQPRSGASGWRRALALAGMDLRGRLADRGAGAAWLVAGPLIGYALFVLVIRHLRHGQPAGLDLEWFLLTGLGPWYLFSALASAVQEARRRDFAALGWPGVTVADLRAAALLVRGGAALLVVALAVAAAWMSDGPPPLAQPWRLLAGVAVVAGLGVACGALADGLRAAWRSVDELWSLLTRGLFLTSGAFFSLADLPPGVAGWLWFNPLVHAVEQGRHALDPAFPTTGTGFFYPAVVTAAAGGAAWAVNRRWRVRLRERP